MKGTANWSTSDTTPLKILLEEPFVSSTVDSRAEAYVNAVQDRMIMEKKGGNYQDGRLGFILMMIEPFVALQQIWINQRLWLRQANTRAVTKSDIHLIFNVLLLMHLTEPSQKTVFNLLQGLGFAPPTKEICNIFTANMCTYHPSHEMHVSATCRAILDAFCDLI